MRVVFMGTPEFAVPALEALVADHEVCAVYTRPDAVSGRGKKLRPSPVKETALKSGLLVETPSGFRSMEAVAQLAAFCPDVVVVAAYGVILPREVLDIPAFGCINIHASLLPRWRGAAPVQRAILSGDEVTGVSVMRMEEGLDTGDFCLQSEIRIAQKNSDELTFELACAGAELIVDALSLLEQGSVVWTQQDDMFATYANRILKQDVLLFPLETASTNVLHVRASGSTAPAKARICGKSVTVLAAHEIEGMLDAGEVAFRHGQIVLGCMRGAFVVDRVKPDGKSAMEGSAWMAGLKTAPMTWSEL